MRRASRSRAHRRGFSLLEVTIALGILAFGLLAVGAMQLHALRGGATSQNLSDASMIANQQLEVLNRVAWTDAQLGDTSDAWVAVGTRQSAGRPYAVSRRVTDVSGDLKNVEVRVTWTSELERPQQLVFSSARLREVTE